MGSNKYPNDNDCDAPSVGGLNGPHFRGDGPDDLGDCDAARHESEDNGVDVDCFLCRTAAS